MKQGLKLQEQLATAQRVIVRLDERVADLRAQLQALREAAGYGKPYTSNLTPEIIAKWRADSLKLAFLESAD